MLQRKEEITFRGKAELVGKLRMAGIHSGAFLLICFHESGSSLSNPICSLRVVNHRKEAAFFLPYFCIFSASITLMRSKKLLLFLFFMGVFCSAQAQENKQLKQILTEIRQFNEREFPSDTALSPFPLGRYREEDILRRGAFSKTAYDKLDAIPVSQLSASDKINVALLNTAFGTISFP